MGPRTDRKDESGLVFDIQRFSIHDGPGIRTTVFLKGCPLRCRWCSNPESQDFTQNLMVRDLKCAGCGACVDACPEGAVTLSPEGVRKIDRNACSECLACVESCLYHSLNRCGQRMSVEEVLEEVCRDEAFYRNSGGGMTVSGGEPLAQSLFLVGLMAAAKEAGLHTVLDTSGYASWESLERALPFVDLILWDIKHLDNDAHKAGTGVENGLILDNLRKTGATAKRIWLRLPLIGDYNDSEAHIREVVALAKSVHAEKISLLPYHEGGKSKCDQLGRAYPFPEGKSPTTEKIQRLQEIIETAGLKVSIRS